MNILLFLVCVALAIYGGALLNAFLRPVDAGLLKAVSFLSRLIGRC